VIPAPRDLAAPIGFLVAELEHEVGTERAVDLALELLGGDGSDDWVPWFAGKVDPRQFAPYWRRVWGARGLLYVWSDRAAGPVVAGLDDEAWRVAEMCLKVAVRRELAEAADAAVPLSQHELARVRGQALRLLGVAGEHEHLAAVRAREADPDEDVRRRAARALARLEERLDL
jgi:HEAT repeat protein